MLSWRQDHQQRVFLEPHPKLTHFYRGPSVFSKPWPPTNHSSEETHGVTGSSSPTHPVPVTGHSAEALPSCLPTGPVAEHNEALLVCPLDEGHTSVLLPVSHGLFKNGPLAA